MPVLKLLNIFYNIGAEKVKQPRLKRKLRLLNQIAFVSIAITLIWVFLTYALEGKEVVLLHYLTLVPILLILLSNFYGWVNTSRMLWQLFFLGVITFYSLTNSNTGTIYYFYPLLVSVFATFYLDEWKKFTPLIILETGALLFVNITNYRVPYQVTNSSFMEAYGEITGMISAFVASTAILYYLIYENRQSEISLEAERNNLNSIISSTNDGIWLIKNDYTLLTFNETFKYWMQQATGITPYEGMNMIKALGEFEEQFNIKANLDKVIHSGKALDLEQSIYIKNFEVFLEISLNPVNEKKQVKAVSGFAKDVTERKRMDAELKRAKAEAEESSAAKSRFLSNMSHELRTPLNAISGLTQLMEQENLDSKNIENLRVIQLSADQLLALINNILDFSRIESGEKTFKSDQFNPFKVLKQIKSTFSFKASEAEIEFVAEADEEIPQLLIGDSTVLMQVLNNLVGNAFKFCDEGYVKVYLSKKQANEDEIVLKGTVEDTGIGIPKDKQEHVFEAFKQVEEHESRKYQGSGLGLSITKKLVEGLNGSINFESEEQKGSTFYFELPFKVAQDAQSNDKGEAKSEEAQNTIQGAKVLLVEDNKMNLRVAVQMLKKLNANPYTAEGGAEALEYVKSENFDLILLDIHMPDIDGFEVARQTRQLKGGGTSPQVPIIVMSADVFSSTKQQAVEIGIDDFIEKPVNMNQLNQKLNYYLG